MVATSERLGDSPLEGMFDDLNDNGPTRADELARLIGDDTMARILVATDEGNYPDNSLALLDVLEASRMAEAKAGKRYIALSRKIGEQLRAARATYEDCSERTRRIFEHVASDL